MLGRCELVCAKDYLGLRASRSVGAGTSLVPADRSEERTMYLPERGHAWFDARASGIAPHETRWSTVLGALCR